MSRYNWHFDAREEYEKGRRDEENYRHDWEHDKWSCDDKDKAYFEGREDYRREKERREEERREEEHQAYLNHQRQLEKQQEEDYYEEQIQEKQAQPNPQVEDKP